MTGLTADREHLARAVDLAGADVEDGGELTGCDVFVPASPDRRAWAPSTTPRRAASCTTRPAGPRPGSPRAAPAGGRLTA
ncbi:hypothetical protein AB2L28_04590 [Kineococcus sp. TBRC 1896]|uniref:Uncharacterized protein n=1 Tax=Kineococcus mangrovi TaxID=1660183 RepID=A0ABV4HYK7_9ACTN